MEEKEDRARASAVRTELGELERKLAREITNLDDAKAAALFETAREVLRGLSTAFEHYAAQSEPVWKSAEMPEPIAPPPI